MEQVKIGSGCPKLPLQEDGTMTPCQKWACMFWRPVQVDMIHPQTGDKIAQNEWDCVIALQFIGTLDVARKTNQIGAAVESLRNAVIKKQAQLAVPQIVDENYIGRSKL